MLNSDLPRLITSRACGALRINPVEQEPFPRIAGRRALASRLVSGKDGVKEGLSCNDLPDMFDYRPPNMDP